MNNKSDQQQPTTERELNALARLIYFALTSTMFDAGKQAAIKDILANLATQSGISADHIQLIAGSYSLMLQSVPLEYARGTHHAIKAILGNFTLGRTYSNEGDTIDEFSGSKLANTISLLLKNINLPTNLYNVIFDELNKLEIEGAVESPEYIEQFLRICDGQLITPFTEPPDETPPEENGNISITLVESTPENAGIEEIAAMLSGLLQNENLPDSIYEAIFGILRDAEVSKTAIVSPDYILEFLRSDAANTLSRDEQQIVNDVCDKFDAPTETNNFQKVDTLASYPKTETGFTLTPPCNRGEFAAHLSAILNSYQIPPEMLDAILKSLREVREIAGLKHDASKCEHYYKSPEHLNALIEAYQAERARQDKEDNE